MKADNIVQLIDLEAAGNGRTELDGASAGALGRIEAEVGAVRTLNEALDILWREAQNILPCDRMGLSFVEQDGERVVARYSRAAYEPLLLGEGYAAGLSGSTLQTLIDGGRARVIRDLSAYVQVHPNSASSKILVREGVRSSLTLPLRVGDRSVGFLFFSSRKADAFTPAHAEVVREALGRIAEAVEKGWTIKQLEDAKAGYLEMLGFVSHEMKSPLAALVTRGEMYLRGYLGTVDPEAQKVVERMNRAAGYLINMVSNYLDLARLERGEMRFQPAEGVRFRAEVLDFALDTVAARAEERKSTVRVEGPEEILVDGDADLLRIVAINLIDNAIKYGREEIEVQVRLACAEERLTFAVRNPGVGFTEEQSRKLFRRFSRLKAKGTEDRKGSGLGLYLTWWIVQKHGGRIEAKSEPGEWAEFTVTLPKARLP